MKHSLQYVLEQNLGPDPLNPAADLACIAASLYNRIQEETQKLNELKLTYRNALSAIDTVGCERET